MFLSISISRVRQHPSHQYTQRKKEQTKVENDGKALKCRRGGEKEQTMGITGDPWNCINYQDSLCCLLLLFSFERKARREEKHVSALCELLLSAVDLTCVIYSNNCRFSGGETVRFFHMMILAWLWWSHDARRRQQWLLISCMHLLFVKETNTGNVESDAGTCRLIVVQLFRS